MALNIKNPEVERLATEVARLTGRTKTEAIRRALEAERDRLQPKRRDLSGLMKWLEEEVWPNIPPDQLGKTLTKEEEEEILGIGPDGV